MYSTQSPPKRTGTAAAWLRPFFDSLHYSTDRALLGAPLRSFVYDGRSWAYTSCSFALLRAPLRSWAYTDRSRVFHPSYYMRFLKCRFVAPPPCVVGVFPGRLWLLALPLGAKCARLRPATFFIFPAGRTVRRGPGGFACHVLSLLPVFFFGLLWAQGGTYWR